MIPAREKKKGIALIGLGLLFLAFNGWITTRLLTLVISLALINYGLLKMGKPSLASLVRNTLAALKIW